MKTIYLITASFGSWDGHHVKIVKSFYNKPDAKMYAEKYSIVMKELSNFVQEVQQIVFDKHYDTEEEYANCFHHQIWSKYSHSHEEFNECYIKEITIE